MSKILGVGFSGQAAALTALAFSIHIATIALVILLASSSDSGTLDRTVMRITYLTTITGAVILCLLYITLLYTTFTRLIDRAEIHPLLWPTNIKAGAIFTILLISAITVLDLTIHNLVPEWAWIRRPFVRLFNAIAFLVLILPGFGWYLAIVLRGRGWTRQAVATFYGVAVVGSVVAVYVVVYVAGGRF